MLSKEIIDLHKNRLENDGFPTNFLYTSRNLNIRGLNSLASKLRQKELYCVIGKRKLNSETRKLLRDNGWKYLNASCREVWRKGKYVVKFALDGFSIEQNYVEAKILNNPPKHKVIKFPKLYCYDPRYTWIISQYIGRTSNYIPQKIFNECSNLGIDDVDYHNIRVKNKKYYVIDAGIVVYSLAGV